MPILFLGFSRNECCGAFAHLSMTLYAITSSYLSVSFATKQDISWLSTSCSTTIYQVCSFSWSASWSFFSWSASLSYFITSFFFLRFSGIDSSVARNASIISFASSGLPDTNWNILSTFTFISKLAISLVTNGKYV